MVTYLGNMNRAFEQIRKHWLSNLITFFVSLVVGVAIFLVMFLTRNRTIIAAVDGAALATAVVLLGGLLALMGHLGAFDLFVFGVKQLGSMLFAKNPRRDGDYADYRDEKQEKRVNSTYSFVAIIAAGIICLIALVVLEIIYNISM